MTDTTIRELIGRRDQFRRDPLTQEPDELPLREKQALVERILRNEPLTKEISYREAIGDDGKTFYLVTRGWAQLKAILDFTDNKFPTWTADEKRAYEQSKKRQT